MMQYCGKSVNNGIALGEITVFKKADEQTKRVKIDNSGAEIERFRRAREKALAQLEELYDKALTEVGESGAAIFEMHQMLLSDMNYVDDIHNIIAGEQVNAEYAVAVTGEKYANMFADMDDEYMQARSTDMKDISNRIVHILQGNTNSGLLMDNPSIIVADDLTPSDTIQLNKAKIMAFVTVHGSMNSHTAILARMMNIPALVRVDVDMDSLENGMTAIVDCTSDTFILEPTIEQIEMTKARMLEESDNKKMLQVLVGQENVTLGGKKIDVFANIGSVNDLDTVLENDAGGIGLFRSEFLYLEREDFPSEEEQFSVYQKVLRIMGEKKVIIRTLDIGADKKVDYFQLEKEDNPALGYRAIRICLTRRDIFKTQLRALLRASVYGNLSVMYPMITSVEEVEKIQEIIQEVARELEGEKIPYKMPEQGIMIETPAAVMISDELSQLVDFFSIGTNDLTQYTLAIDRQNERLEAFYNPYHKAIIKMIQMVVDNAHKAGKWVGICGELGADTKLTKQFVEMGVDELSVVPSMVLMLRKEIRNLD